MAEIILITGGARSGKSRYAQDLAEASGPRRVYVATCPRPGKNGYDDPELERRIQRHITDRAHRNWTTVEESCDLAGVLPVIDAPVVLVDCLTLWVNNLLYERDMDEDGVAAAAAQLAEVCRQRPGRVILVTNEVGCGIVPDNAVTRHYRDCVGRCNQALGRAADRVVLVVCGQELVVKGGT